MEGTGITPVMSMNPGYGDGFGFGGSGLWLFAILALMWGGNGLFGNNGLGYRPATAEDVNNGFNFSELQAETRDVLGAIRQNTYDTTAAIERVGAGIVSDIHDVQMVAAQNQAITQQCCCNALRAIDGVNYNAAMNTAAINANTTAGVQKILDTLKENEIEALRDKVGRLELAQAVNGVVRYPNTLSYSAGQSPFCNCNGFGNI